MNKELLLRLTKYKRLLHKLKALGLERVFSNNLGDAIGVTASLVRKDFSILNLPGNKRGGYNIDTLIQKLDELLGCNRPQEVIVVGCGKIGTALMQHKESQPDMLRIVAGFDLNPAEVIKLTDTPIYPMGEIASYVKENGIKVGIIAVPDSEASAVMDVMIKAGIKGILNFASVELKSSRDFSGIEQGCIVHNVNIGLELEHLFYQINLNESGRLGQCYDDSGEQA